MYVGLTEELVELTENMTVEDDNLLEVELPDSWHDLAMSVKFVVKINV